MSFIFKRSILLFLITLFNFIKNKSQSFDKINSLRFLFENNNDNALQTNNLIPEYYEKGQYDYFFETIKYMNPLNMFEEKLNSTAENDGFKVRCFWLDSTTMRVFDLSQLKSAK